MLCYWDTSALLALLLKESFSAKVRSFAERAGLPGYTSFFTLIEMESAFSRRLQEGSLADEDLPLLRAQAQKLEKALGVLWPQEETLAESRRMILEYRLKPGDALQLASSKDLLEKESEVTFVSLDTRLNQAAAACGYVVPWQVVN